MPQITLEYTSNINHDINFNELFAEVHRVLSDVGNIDINNCKSRAIKLDDYYIGNGEIENAFIHLAIRLLEGREEELKRKIGWEIMKVLEDFYYQCFTQHRFQITLEINDIFKNSYFKIPRIKY
ncbi:MAG: 5-carboxymethyl-2-hydroxymuconate Delta-isomerase [Melioribacteraceae bacterium]|nr:5-carboxymethyl-2-hydroxymuconate Delta-isomerase [Melioribacteraceae bacterium]